MQRWDYIQSQGKQECAKAIAFWVVNSLNRDVSCEQLIESVKLICPIIEDWLSDEINVEEEM